MTKSTADPNQPHGGVALDDQPAPDQPVDKPRRDPLDVLTVAEIDAGSRKLGDSLVKQVSTKGDRYEQALAIVLWLHQRRTDRSTNPDELLRQLRQLRFGELSAQLVELGEQLAEHDDGAADPLASRSE